ncbi:CaiB/BaiF CoA transferase family protein [Yinghuangia soli]|uniref:CoA transferase n=1 Tax=Yinghuangia soli TaxID=2908204 RepID=A0AA41PWS4_9ACTN|nr:CaiB/BaiF CoA-transferase family protein [Yinghuangia soli]MCF2525987.1 CoA transferase [Yinghuangia soli]
MPMDHAPSPPPEAAEDTEPGAGPLAGIVVVALEQAVSAPFATRHLGDYGARIIKVERPDGGDFARDYDDLASGMGAHFTWCNRNKESVALDLASPEGRQAMAALLARADVFVQNLAPGAAARLGLGGAELTQRHPRLVVCEVSGYGVGGPYDARRAYDVLVQAEGAVATVTGSLDEPLKAQVPVADLATGLYALSAITTALLHRERTGRGCVLQVSMLDTIAELMGYCTTVVRHGGTPEVRRGMSHPAISPYDAYRAGDGRHVVVSVTNDREWARLAEHLLGRPELARDPAFAKNPDRVRNRAAADALISAALAAHTADAAIALLEAAGVPCGKVNSVAELVDHPQLTARGRWQQVGSPVGPIPALLPPVVSDTWAPRLDPVPALGEHTAKVLADLDDPS